MATVPATRLSGVDRRRQILDAAMGLFARQGFEGTTTRQITRRAGVNEAIIFRHFPTKEDLYWAIIERRCQTSGRRQIIESQLASGASDREVFTGIAEQILRRGPEDSLHTRLLLYTALERHELSHRFFRTYAAESYELLAQYIRRRTAQGAYRDVDPQLAARSFLGMIVYHILVQELFGGDRIERFDPRRVAESLADIWLQGMTARPPARPNGRHGNGNGGRRRRNGGPGK